MKATILYAALDPGRHKDYTRVQGAGIAATDNPTVLYVRAVTIYGDVSEALDKANPRKGEIVLNSVPSPEDWRGAK